MASRSEIKPLAFKRSFKSWATEIKAMGLPKLAVPRETPPVFELLVLLYHWYVNPVPVATTVNGVAGPLVQTDCELAAVGEVITVPLTVKVIGNEPVQPVVEFTVFKVPEYVPAGKLAGIVIPVIFPLPVLKVIPAPDELAPATQLEVVPESAKFNSGTLVAPIVLVSDVTELLDPFAVP